MKKPSAKKPAKPARARKKFSIKMVVDLSGWNMGDWSMQLEEHITAKFEDGQVVVGIGSDGGLAMQKVSEEIVRAFFDEGFYPCFTPKGIHLLTDSEGEIVPDVTIPFDALMIQMTESDPEATTLALAKWLYDELNELELVDKFTSFFAELNAARVE